LLNNNTATMRILGLIPARGGSKGVPRKNIRMLGSKPMLAFTAESALGALRLTRVVLSTEDEEIAAVGERYGLEVPFLRPRDLAEDVTPTLPVVQHAIAELEKQGDRFDAVCLLQPTNPLRRSADIDGCIELLECSMADAVVSVLPVPHEYNPKWVFWMNGGGRISIVTGESEPISRRQDLPPAYHRDGSVYVTRRDVVMNLNSLYGDDLKGYVADPKFSANIDTEKDWEKIEKLLG
jgi:CMP-N,N'-diacetyllegionaminic acid synthase